MFLKRKIPISTISVEIDDKYSGLLNLDGKEIAIEPEVAQFILNVIKENDYLSEKVEYYEQFITGKADA